MVYASDAVIAPLDLVSERIDGGYAETTRSFPTYYHGNRFVLDDPPDAYSIADWIARYREHFAWRTSACPGIITWYDTLEGSLPVGLPGEIESAIALRANPLRAAVPARDDVRFEPIAGEGWDELARLNLEVTPEFGAFNCWRVGTLRELVAAGRGVHYGLRDARGALVAAAGGYHRANVARFANVITAPHARKAGLARYLVGRILKVLREQAPEVLIVADAGSSAERLYRAAGFTPLVAAHSLVLS